MICSRTVTENILIILLNVASAYERAKKRGKLLPHTRIGLPSRYHLPELQARTVFTDYFVALANIYLFGEYFLRIMRQTNRVQIDRAQEKSKKRRTKRFGRRFQLITDADGS